MRLSEAIRLGAMLHPQGFGRGFHDGRTCALGAAYAALNIPWDTRTDTIQRYMNIPEVASLRCPVCGRVINWNSPRLTVAAVVVELNDVHRWTRERIADWVETIERFQEAPSVPPSVDASDPHVLHPGNLATRA